MKINTLFYPFCQSQVARLTFPQKSDDKRDEVVIRDEDRLVFERLGIPEKITISKVCRAFASIALEFFQGIADRIGYETELNRCLAEVSLGINYKLPLTGVII